MRTLILTSALFGLFALLATGCSFHARDADSYRKATRALLETRSGDIKGCYDAELKKDPKVGGKVVVKFTVAKETGTISGAKVVESKTTAPATLSECVVKAIDGLALDPPDERDGDAQFQWEFQATS
jgi:DNA polymerase/3'-5' exonuclease PolX